MQFIIYILVYPIIWLISILPFSILYLISDFFYILIYYIFGYRKKVVLDNLILAFPEKKLDELKKIRKKFYHHFIDIFVEMIKSFTISEKNLKRRYTFNNIELIQNLEKKGKSIVLMGAHYANWEWVFIMNKYVSCKGVAAYSKIENKYFDKAIRKSRGRFGTILVRTSKLIELLDFNKKNNITAIYGLLSDQSPMVQKTKYWNTFLGVTVPIHTGAEYLAKKNNFAVVMIKTSKLKRGYYTSEFKLLTENPKNYKNYDITDMFLREVESQIYSAPEYYFWTHNRFKHKDKAPKD